jgi:sigma-B regulation protein RsbU (phosphoserine phosphatase)
MEHALQRSIENLKQATAAKQRIESELKIAHDIQMSMVPKIFPPFPDREEFDLYATLVPAREVGGDFYDFFFLDKDHLCLAIGDVSGKGVPASLFMAVTKTLFKATANGNDHPDEILQRLNDEMWKDNTACMFVTLFAAILDIRTGRMEYSNGGHNLPYKLSNGQPKQFENTKGTVVGVLDGARFEKKAIALEPGDWIIFYTDGVTEAMDEHKELFSERRLEQFLASLDPNVSAEELTHRLSSEVGQFSATTAQSDDITILVLRYWGVGNHAHSKVTLELKNELSELAKLNHTLAEFGQRHQLPEAVLFAIKLTLEEIVTNAISHNFTDEREHRISIRLTLEQSVLRAEVEDDGRPFNPLEIPAPDPKQPLEERPVGGLGIHLVRTLMDEVAYRRQNSRNVLVLKKEITEP